MSDQQTPQPDPADQEFVNDIQNQIYMVRSEIKTLKSYETAKRDQLLEAIARKAKILSVMEKEHGIKPTAKPKPKDMNEAIRMKFKTSRADTDNQSMNDFIRRMTGK